MINAISHNRMDEELVSKARWFQSLSLEERMALLCEYSEMILSVNPRIVERKSAQPVKGRILVLSETRS